MNKHICMGRLTRDPELRYTQTSTRPVARFRLAVDRRVKKEGQPTADFFNFVCFDKQAEFVEKYLRKGTKVLVESRPQNNEYTKEDGTQVFGIEFYVESIEFAESRAATDEQQPPAAGTPAPAPARAGKSAGDGFTPYTTPDEDLPF